jgi:hypothetical protein
VEDQVVLAHEREGMVQRPHRRGGEYHVIKRTPRLDCFDELAAGSNTSEEEIADRVCHGYLWLAGLLLV